jgi:Malectin domain
MRKIVFQSVCACATACLVSLVTGCHSGDHASSQAAAQPAPAAVLPATTPAPAATPAAAAAAPESAVKVVRVKAGLAAPLTDSSGNVWEAERGFSGGETIERDASTSIANTKDPQLFLTEHYSMNSFACDVPNGKYLAKLYFAETFDGISGPGQRVFSFNVHGREFKDFDVWVKAGGPNKAYVETVPVEVTDGKFKIVFTSNIENPEINAIELIPQT